MNDSDPTLPPKRQDSPPAGDPAEEPTLAHPPMNAGSGQADKQLVSEVDIDRAEMTISQFLNKQGLRGGVELDDSDSSAADSLRDRQGRKYDMGDVIARGGMGAVLDAKDHCIRRHVAMKVMLQDHQSPKAVLRFIEEAQVTGQLEHPSIVPVHELGVDSSGTVFYTMKYVQGRTLKDVLEAIRSGDRPTIEAYPLVRLLNVFLRVCDAMSFAHARKVIHRDLKPENIMLGDFGEVLVVDWGLAKVMKESESKKEPVEADAPTVYLVRSDRAEDVGDGAHTMDGSVLGTPAFMPPEQAAGRLTEIDERSDIYSLGAVLYNILTLNQPVRGDDVTEMLAKVETGDITHPTLFSKTAFGRGKKGDEDLAIELQHCQGRKVPESLAAVAMKALSLKPEDRYQSVQNLQKDVQAYLDGFATLAENANLVRQCILLFNRNRKQATVLTATALLVVGITAAFMTQLNQKKAEAQAARDKAVVAAKKAESAQADAEVARALAEQKAEETRRTLYASEMLSAQAAMNEPGGALKMKKLLDHWLPQEGETDLRGWEWFYLNSQLENAGRLFPYKNGARTAVWSSDGRRIFTGGGDGHVAVWDVESGMLIKTHPGGQGFITAIDISPDNSRVATLTRGGFLKILNVESGAAEFERKLATTEDYGAELSWHRDGSRLLASDGPDVLVLIDLKTGDVTKRLEEKRTIRAADWHSDGRRLAVGAGPDLVIWDISSDEMQRLKNVAGGQNVLDADWTRDSKVVIHGTVVPYLAEPALESSQPFPLTTLTPHILNADISGSSGLVAYPGGDRGVHLIDVRRKRRTKIFQGHLDAIYTVEWSPDGERLLSSGNEGVRIWQVGKGDPEKVHHGHPNSVEWNPVTDELAVGDRTGVRTYGPAGYRKLDEYSLSEKHYMSSWSSDGDSIAVASATNLAVWQRGGIDPLWESTISRKRSDLPGGLKWEPGGDRIMYGINTSTFSLYSARDGALLRKWDTRTRTFAWHPEGKYLIYESRAGQIMLADPRTGEAVKEWSIPHATLAMAWHPSGDILATARTSDHLVEIWRMPDAEKIAEFTGGALNIMDMAWSPDGKLLAVGSIDSTMKIWSFEVGRVVLSFQEDGPVADLDWDATGARLAVGIHRELGSVKVLDAGREFLAHRAPEWLARYDRQLELRSQRVRRPAEPAPKAPARREPATAEEPRVQHFRNLDKDSDQRVSREEYVEAFVASFVGKDRDGDGVLSHGEFRYAAAFKVMDADGDGRATKAEFETFYSNQFTGRDKDKSGFMTLDEM